VYEWVMLATSTLVITADLLRLIAEIEEFKGAWRAFGSLAPERLSALRRVATIESIGSSTRIEGSKLSNRQVETLLANLSIQAFETRDEQEVGGYAEVMETVCSSWEHIPWYFCGGFFGNTSFSRWQWSFEPCVDNAFAASGRLPLCT
jgi:hypothetical protein